MSYEPACMGLPESIPFGCVGGDGECSSRDSRSDYDSHYRKPGRGLNSEKSDKKSRCREHRRSQSDASSDLSVPGHDDLLSRAACDGCIAAHCGHSVSLRRKLAPIATPIATPMASHSPIFPASTPSTTPNTAPRATPHPVCLDLLVIT